MYVKTDFGKTETYMTGTGFTLFTVVQAIFMITIAVALFFIALGTYLGYFVYFVAIREPKPWRVAFDSVVNLWPDR